MVIIYEKNNYKLTSNKVRICEEGFSVHTLLMKKQLTYELYRVIKNNAYQISDELKARIYKKEKA